MYWSCVGLLIAFVAEGMTRLPILLVTDRAAADLVAAATGGFKSAVLTMVVAMVVAMGVGDFGFRRYRKCYFRRA